MYGKIFASMYDGTLATRGPWQALVTFQQMIVLAEADGTLDMTAEALSRRTTIPLDIITTGIAALERPDEQSRSDAEDGRRIVRLDPERPWGWRIVNHRHYRAIRTAEERREYMREYQRRKRKLVNHSLTPVTNVNNVTDTDAEAEAEASIGTIPIDTSPSNSALPHRSLSQGGVSDETRRPRKIAQGKRGSRTVPEDWQPSEKLLQRIKDELVSDCLARGGTTVDLELERFRSCTFGTPRTDWDRTAWNWLLTECKRVNEREARDERYAKARR